MMHRIWSFGMLFLLLGTAHAQTNGVPTSASLSGGITSLALDFTNHDYELILYSGQTDATDTSRTYAYSVTLGAASKWANIAHAHRPATSSRDHFEAQLRHKERALAQRLMAEGGWHPSARKTTQQQTGSTRSFVFEKFGGVTSDRAVTATLIATSTRAIGYLDNALPASTKNITTAQIQSMLDQFSTSTYPLVTSTFGAPSDVDNDGKVIFLFTHLVDDVGGVAGFYSSGSLFSTSRGGDGNEADMMFISPTRDLASYESLLAHEYQHLINFNQHVLVNNGSAEESWLNEGLSHVTEDMVGGHIEGGNTDLVATYLNAPERYALTGEAQLNSGIRGVAYLFVRGLMEEFGANVPGQLVQTNRVGIPNVEQVAVRTFDTVFQTFVSRLFLSGNKLNASASLNYTFEFFLEPQTQKRSFATPLEHQLTAQNPAVSGAVKPAAPSFIRLSGTGSQTVQIQAALSGNFHALTIPLPKGYQPALALPINFFEKLTLDAPLPGVVTAGESLSFSGSTSDVGITQVLLSFEPRNGQGEEIRFSADVSGGRFDQSIVFAPSQTGEYTLGVFAGQQGELLPQVGQFPGFIVSAGDGTVTLPTNYFNGLTLNAPLPAQYAAGQGASLAGTTTDAGIEVLLLVFTSKTDGSEIRIQTDVASSAFRKGFVFLSEQAGTYDLDLYGGAKGGSLAHRGGFSPVVVTSTGTETVKLPVDIFDNVILDTELNRTFAVGQAQNLSGQVTDPSITQIAISFSPLAGGSDIDTFVDVNNRQFSADVTFSQSQIGQYEFRMFGGPKGQSLSFIGSFSSIEVTTARPSISLATKSLTWPELIVGNSQTQTLSISNTGSQTLSISNMLTEVPFSASPNTLTLTPGATGTVVITFSPSSAGNFSGALQITSNDPDKGTQTLSLTGSAKAEQVVTTPSPDFDGNGDVGFSDFLAFAGVFGAKQGHPTYDAKFDLDSSGDIGFSDFLTFAAAFGKSVSG